MITLELYELKNLCLELAELGASRYAKRVTPGKDLISQREAYRQFGEARIKDWTKRNLISSTRSGSHQKSKKLYSISEILSVETANQLNFWINR